MSATSTPEAPYADFGRHLTKLRKMAGITRSDFAKECGVALSSMQNYENGIRSPQAHVILAMARVLHITTDELLDKKEIEADIFEEQGFEGEALTKRQQARIIRNMRESKNILYSGGLSPIDTTAYVLALQRLLLDAMEYNTKKYSSSSFPPEKHKKFEESRKKLDPLWDTVDGHSEKSEEDVKE